jgi:two-component system chemotaxis sensor kinase CheA
MATVVEPCHILEEKLQESKQPLSPEEIGLIATAWKLASDRLVSLLGDRKKRTIELEELEFIKVLHRIKNGASNIEIAEAIERWRLDPLATRFQRFKEQAMALGKKLDIKNMEVEISDGDILLEPGAFSDIWTNMTHIIRNALDHGLKEGSSSKSVLSFRAEKVGSHLRISIADNGNGIQWDKIRAKAQAAGMPHKSQSDLVEALFADGLSTRDSVTTTSGRGVGMSAVKESVQSYGGKITIESVSGQGTTVLIYLPLDAQFHKIAKSA